MAKKSITIHELIKAIVARDTKDSGSPLTFAEVAAWIGSHLYAIEAKGSVVKARLENPSKESYSSTLLGKIAAAQNPHLGLEVNYDLAAKVVSIHLAGATLPDEMPSSPDDLGSLACGDGLALAGLLLLDAAIINRGGASASGLAKLAEGENPSAIAPALVQSLTKAFDKTVSVTMSVGSGTVSPDATKAEADALRKLFPNHPGADAEVEAFSPFVRSSKEPWSEWHKALIPSGVFYESSGQDLPIAELAIAKDLPLLLIGEPGQGKTQLVRHLAEKYKMPLVVLNGHGQMAVEDLLGGMVLKGGNTEVEPAGFARACADGCWVLLNEPNAMPEKVQLALYSILDDTRMATIGNTVVKAHRDTRFFFTANPVGFRGVRPMTEAMVSRMGIKVDLPQPTKTQFETVIATKVKGVTKKVVQAAWAICEELRKHSREGSLQVTPASFYLRDAIAFASVAAHLKPKVAFEVTALAAWQNPEERKQVAALVERYLK